MVFRLETASTPCPGGFDYSYLDALKDLEFVKILKIDETYEQKFAECIKENKDKKECIEAFNKAFLVLADIESPENLEELSYVINDPEDEDNEIGLYLIFKIQKFGLYPSITIVDDYLD